MLLLSRFSHVRLCATPETAAYQAPLSWDSAGKNTGVGCHFLLQCIRVKSQSELAQLRSTLRDPMDCTHQAPPSMGFSRQEYWSGVPLPSPKVILEPPRIKSLTVSIVSPSVCHEVTDQMPWSYSAESRL